MKNKTSPRFWAALILFSLTGQIAWVVENMYFNVFIYKIFSASAEDISAMVAASAVAATLTTVFIGALSDRVGKRKLFISGGYILWGLSILSFSLVRLDVISTVFPAAASASAVAVTVVIVLDCVMTFFGSSANDAAFNAWLTDSTDSGNRGAAEGLNSMMPLIAILAVFGGFMSFDLSLADSWNTIFTVIGSAVIVIGILGIFLIKEPEFTPDKSGYFSTVFYGFSPRTVRENKSLYLTLISFIIFNISIQIFMPYLIIYYEVSLGMTDYVLIMAPAIVLASVVTALWGRVYDKKGFGFSSTVSLVLLTVGYIILYFTRAKLPVFIGSLLMMSGYLSGMAVFGARIRDKTPDGKAGRLQGVRIFSQVLLPGVIGPFIGKTVLRGAETIVGNDGLESFVPSADIFSAALVPAVILLLLVIFTKNDPPSTARLTTDYEPADIPHGYHPNPMMKRDTYTVLNGKWRFTAERAGKTDFEGEITVPFCPESDLSGVGRITTPDDKLTYERIFTAPEHSGRIILHFEAVDDECEVFVNSKKVGQHRGGYLPFEFDVTDFVQAGENKLTVTVRDRLDGIYPYGKQKHKRGGMWYTPVSGIWQTVWLEYVPETYIKGIKLTPTLYSVRLEVEGGEAKKTVLLDGREYTFSGDSYTLEMTDPHLWTPDDPHLYRFTLTSGEDRVESYFALREIGVTEGEGQKKLTLNGKPYYFHGLLDQGYFPDGIYTPANEDAYRDDILRVKELGFNMLRKHIKVEMRIFYYYCDLCGIAVFQDMVNNGGYSFLYDTALPTVGLKKLPRTEKKAVRDAYYETAEATLVHLYNHPSVVYYTIFNEGWGQHDGERAYTKLKSLDPTRIFDTASGWFSSCPSDVQSEHVYFKKADFRFNEAKPVVLSEFGGYSLSLAGHSFNLDKTYGYKLCADTAELTRELEKLYMGEIVPLARRGMSASVLTQVSDVEDETNGIFTYDRRVTKVDKEVMRSISAALFSAYSEGAN